MESLETFIAKLEEEFEELPRGTLTSQTIFRDLSVWDSMHALILVAFIDMEYDVTLRGEDLMSLKTVQDLYDQVK